MVTWRGKGDCFLGARSVEKVVIPEKFDYAEVRGLSNEFYRLVIFDQSL